MGLIGNLFGRGDPRSFYRNDVQYDTCACGAPITGVLVDLPDAFEWLWFHDDDDSPACPE